ncbi:carcinoembryonic antigen-related cell adhesion molecule 1-like isoform X2 [Rhineura floridana]|uniref:carcinoembryonic antigen-related cell adhesion molecule 1-like isoform X2 n=1 Tax=Rhineura floridana TaxID=261503 RepID=UPI002AC80D8A|nr:carcinoembryonic antigen-related cell adhesion molecule 1-like isoform X2 [Rhineura floridana]
MAKRRSPPGPLGVKEAWSTTLLAASILSSCLLLTYAQGGTEFLIKVEPEKPKEGQSVTLTPEAVDLTEFASCSWYRGTIEDRKKIFTYYLVPKPGQVNGSAFTGRETGALDCSLRITNLRANDSAIYTLSMEGPTGFKTRNASLTVLGVVTNINISDPGKAIENNITVLNCTSAGSDVSYSWLKGNQSLVVGGRISLSNNNQTLTFNTTSRNDSDSYSCHGYNTFSNDTVTYLLNVLYGPDVPVISPSAHSYAEGSNLTLSCKADSNPAAQYTWALNETSEVGNTSQLLILNLLFNNTGNYTCKAFNSETNNHSSSPNQEIWVLAKVSNVIITGLSETNESESVSVTLNCTSSGSEVSYFWFKGNQSLEDGGHVSLGSDNQSVIIYPVDRSDAGSYLCLGVNSISNNTSIPFNLTVFYGPDVPVISPSAHSYAEGSNLSLSCKADSNPAAQYTWALNETSEVGNTSQLLILNLLFNNTGNYTCKAFNSETNNHSSSPSEEIRVLETLSSPVLWPPENTVPENTSVTLYCITSNSRDVNVSWFQDGNSLTVPSDQDRNLTRVVTKDVEGIYTCNATNPVSYAVSNSSKITMAYGPNNVKVSPTGTTVLKPGSRLDLLCTAGSVPAAQFWWLFNNTDKNVTKDTFSIDLMAWEDEGNYTCQASNNITKRTVSKSFYVKLTDEENEKVPGGSLTAGQIVGIVIGCVLGAALIAGLLYFLLTKTSLGNKGSQTGQYSKGSMTLKTTGMAEGKINWIPGRH